MTHKTLGGLSHASGFSLPRSGIINRDAALTAHKDAALRMLPEGDRNKTMAYVRSDRDPNKFSHEVQGSFTQFPQLCARVDEQGPKKCLNCIWRLNRLDAMRVKHKEFHGNTHEGDVEEMDLLHYHDEGGHGVSRLVVEDMPARYDMPKIRGLFDLAGEPPRRKRLHKDKTLARLAGSKPLIDGVRFMQEDFVIFAEYNVKKITEHLLQFVHDAVEASFGAHSSARSTTHDFEKAIARSGVLSKVTRRKIARAFLRLEALDRLEHVNRQRYRPQPKLGRSGTSSTKSDRDLQRAGSRSLVHAATSQDLSHGEMRRGLTHMLDEDPEELDDSIGQEPTFHFMTWLRATEHAAVQLDCCMNDGEDVEWTFSIYDMLDTAWAWTPQDAGGDEEGITDEVSCNFVGIFLGITRRPVIMGPEYLASTLSGVRLRDGAGIHLGRKLPPIASPPEVQKDNRNEPAVVVMRLDRRKYKQRPGFASRLWMQRVSGCKVNDEKAQVICDDLKLNDIMVAGDTEIDMYPCVYASRPESDIRHAVKLRNCGDPKAPGMRAADATIGQDMSYVAGYMEAPISPKMRAARSPGPRPKTSPPSKASSSPDASPKSGLPTLDLDTTMKIDESR